MRHKTGTIKWISTYIRQRSGSEHDAYEHKKLEKLSTLKGNLLVMRDINGSIMYTEPRGQWTKRGLGSQAKDAEARNSQMEKVGHMIKKLWNKMQMAGISSKGDFKWKCTRDEVNNKGVKVKNKLDVIAVSSNLVKQCKARVTHIGDPTGLSDDITDHKLLIARLKANNLIRAKSYEALERYKIRKFLESKLHRLTCKMAVATNKAASKIRAMREEGVNAQKISSTLVEELKKSVRK